MRTLGQMTLRGNAIKFVVSLLCLNLLVSSAFSQDHDNPCVEQPCPYLGQTWDSETCHCTDADPPCQDHSFISVDESAGPKYRKVALNGLPLSDEKPQAKDETDQEKEETYVDAFNLSLRHSTTDIFVPLCGGELSLSVRRNLEPETWNDGSGLWPEPTPGLTWAGMPVNVANRIDEPFGVGWSTGINPHIKLVTHITDVPASNCPASRLPGDYAYVTDENGSTHRFLMSYVPTIVNNQTTYVLHFFPMPTGRYEEEDSQNTLEGNNIVQVNYFPYYVYSDYVFKRKYGTTIAFQLDSMLNGSNDANRVNPYHGHEYYSYARATSVTDRYNNRLKYTYNGASSLIPDQIEAMSVTSNGGEVSNSPARRLLINHDDLHISSICDPNSVDAAHPAVSYGYKPYTIKSGNTNAFVPSHTVSALDSVTRYAMPASQTGPVTTSYGYYPAAEVDNNSKVQNSDAFRNYDYQINLTSIKDGRANIYAFTYAPDHSRKNFDSDRGYYATTGNPMIVTRVQPPIGNATTFNNDQSLIYIDYGVPNVNQPIPQPRVNGTRKTTVTDAEGKVRTYDFTDGQIYSLDEFEDLLNYGATDPRRNPFMIVYTGMSITMPYGKKEIYEFDPQAGMALKKTTDFSGNVTTFEHNDAWSFMFKFDWIIHNANHPSSTNSYTIRYPVTQYADPTSQTNAYNQVKHFHYNGEFRVMDRVTDEEGRQTIYGLNGNGLRTSESVYPTAILADNNSIIFNPSLTSITPVKQTIFLYEDAKFSGFMTKKIIKARAGDPDWAKDLVTVYTADGQGHVQTEIVDPDGLALRTDYAYDNNGNKVLVTDPRRYATKFRYDGLNRLVEVDYPSSTANPDPSLKKTYQYDGNSNKVLEVDENTHATIFKYDALNRLTDTGRDMDGDQLLTRSGGKDLVTTYGYNWVNSKTSVQDPKGFITTMTYDDLQRLLTKVDPPPFNYTTTYGYDPSQNTGGNCFDVSSFKPTSILDPRGYTSNVTYDKLYRETDRKIVYDLASPSKIAWTHTEYDKVGNPTDVTDPCSNVTHKVYDAVNRVTDTTYAYQSGTSDEVTEHAFYTGTGLVQKVTDARGKNTLKVYDLAGRVIQVIQPSVDDGTGTGTNQTPTTVTDYDANGNVHSVIDPRHHATDQAATIYGYDERNRRTSEMSPSVVDAVDGVPRNPVKKTTYDRVGNATNVTDARDADPNQSGLHMTITTYDAANRPYIVVQPLVQVLSSTGTVIGSRALTQKKLDLNGNAIQLTDANNNVTINTYDALNRLTDTVDAESNPVHNEYDAAGNRIFVKDANATGMAYGYDGLNRNTFVQDSFSYSPTAYPPAGPHTSDFTYDGLNKRSRVDALGQTTTYDYDHRNRLQTVTYVHPQAGNPNADQRQYTYDENGNIRSVVEPAKGGLADVVCDYDDLNRLTDETSSGHHHQYGYDLAGNRTSARYSVNTTPTGKVLVSVYDALHRLSSLTEGSRMTNYAYDLVGNVLKKTLPGGASTTTSYDALSRAGSVQEQNAGGQTLGSYTYSYDALGNVRRSVEYYASLPAQTVTMSYDGANRLKEEDTSIQGGVTTQIKYGYDHSNNRLSKQTVGGVTTTYTFNNLNQLTGWSNDTGGGGGSFGYDANGNRTTTTPAGATVVANTYGYDFDNRLLSVSQSAGSSYAYTYDYRTRRVIRTENGVSTQVAFSGGTSVAEYPVVGAQDPYPGAKVEFVRGSDWGGGVGGILYSLHGTSGSGTASDPNAPTFDFFNRRGDVVAQTDGSGVLTYQAAYEAFGTRPVEFGQDQDRQRANTKEEDPTGLLNEGMRYRDLGTGVFLTRDPAGMVDGPNLYTYVKQNPWTSFDPEGLTEQFVTTNEQGKEIEIKPTAQQLKNWQAAKDRASKSSEIGAAIVKQFESKDYTLKVDTKKGNEPGSYTDLNSTTTKPDLTHGTISVDLDEKNLISHSTAEVAKQNGIADGRFKNQAEANNQVFEDAGVIVAHEGGHLVLGRKDEDKGGDNVQATENPVRKGLGIPARENYRNTPVPPEMSAGSAQKNKEFIEQQHNEPPKKPSENQ